MTERHMPFSLEAEQSVLGSIMIDPVCMDTAAGILCAEDFHLPEHGAIFSAMQSMYAKSRSIDVVTLLDELVMNGTYDEAGGTDYLRIIAETVPTAANAADYARIVKEKSRLRRIAAAGEEISEAAYGGESAAAVLERAEGLIYALSDHDTNKGFVHIREAIMRVYGHLNELQTNPGKARGTGTGFRSLDGVITGMTGGDLILIGARPGMGKTSFAMNIATEAARSTGKTVCVFSLEMSAEQLANRMLSSEAQIDSAMMRTGQFNGMVDVWEAIAHASSRLSEAEMLIDDTPGVTVSTMKSKLRRVKNPGLVVVDYLQLMQSDRHTDNRVLEVADISRGLKLLAKEMNVPVICCAQLSRAVEQRQNKRPMLSDLRDSGAIEQDADVVMFLYRDEYYNENPAAQSVVEVSIAKNRHGSPGVVKLGWIGKYTKFTELGMEGDR